MRITVPKDLTPYFAGVDGWYCWKVQRPRKATSCSLTVMSSPGEKNLGICYTNIVQTSGKDWKNAKIGQIGRLEECDQSLELQDAKKELIKMEQSRCFSHEINCLKTAKPIAKDSSLRNLVLKLHDDGILYSVGRLDFDELVILPNDSHLTKLIILDIHVNMCHSGIASTLTKLRTSYWITRGRRVVRHSLRCCLVCYRHNCKTYLQQEAPLSKRLSQTKPFTIFQMKWSSEITTSNFKRFSLIQRLGLSYPFSIPSSVNCIIRPRIIAQPAYLYCLLKRKVIVAD